MMGSACLTALSATAGPREDVQCHTLSDAARLQLIELGASHATISSRRCPSEKSAGSLVILDANVVGIPKA